MYQPLYRLVQVVPVGLLGPQVLSLLVALEDQVSHKAQGPPVKHIGRRRQEIGSNHRLWLCSKLHTNLLFILSMTSNRVCSAFQLHSMWILCTREMPGCILD